MNIKAKAALITLSIATGCAVTSLVFNYLVRLLTPDMIPIILMGLGISFCFFAMYQVLVSELEYKEHLKRMVDRK
jgi:hypothetical protein